MKKLSLSAAAVSVLISAFMLGCAAPQTVISSSSVSRETVDAASFSEIIYRTDPVIHKPADLSHAKPYAVFEKGSVVNDDATRSVGLWFITAPEAATYEEYVQTSIQAVLDLRALYRNDFTGVMLFPRTGLTASYTKISYAEASYAADGKGAWGMTGSTPAKPGYWRVAATEDQPYNDQELAIMELWQQKAADFPNHDMFSSRSYDERALRQYIADTLNISYSATYITPRSLTVYQLDETYGLE